MSELTVKDFVSKDNRVQFDSFRTNVFYYTVAHIGSFERYLFQVPLEDVSGVTFLSRDKSIYYMRWIRKSIKDGTLIKQKIN